jgi:nucleoside-diphosphate-sugar epimerase
VARGEAPTAHPKLEHTRADLCDPAVPRALKSVDILWHLGAQLWRSVDGRQIQINIDGTINVLEAQPKHVVFSSSAAVYGAHPDNPLPITEDHLPRPNAECPYAWHKLEGERLCRQAGSAAILRIGAVVGPHADARVAEASQGYKAVVPAVRHVPQALQFIHEDDVTRGLLQAGFLGTPGTWNLATEDWLDAQGVAAISGGRVVAVPRTLLVKGSEAAYRLHLVPFGADRSALIDGPLALDPARAIADLEWRPRLSSATTLRGFLRT